jgi:Uma2 family endonuclease
LPQVPSTQFMSLHLWNVEEYHQLLKARLVGTSSPCELIAGQVVSQSALPSMHHVRWVRQLKAMLQYRLGTRALVRSQKPVILGRQSEPCPDLVVVKGDAARYRYHNPTPVEIVLMIEVSDGKLVWDCGLKAIEYAQGGIQDYWVFDLSREQIHIFRDPLHGRYRTRFVINTSEKITLKAFPEIGLRFSPPKTLYFLTRQLAGRHRHASQSWTLLPEKTSTQKAQALGWPHESVPRQPIEITTLEWAKRLSHPSEALPVAPRASTSATQGQAIAPAQVLSSNSGKGGK